MGDAATNDANEEGLVGEQVSHDVEKSDARKAFDEEEGASNVVETSLKEIQRRRAYVESQSETGDSSVFPGSQAASSFGERRDHPFLREDQSFLVFSLSQSGFGPVSSSPERTAIRLYGCFPSLEEAVEQRSLVQEKDPLCSLLVGHTHDWMVAAPSPSEYTDPSFVSSKLEELFRERERKREEGKAGFEQRRETCRRECEEEHAGKGEDGKEEERKEEAEENAERVLEETGREEEERSTSLSSSAKEGMGKEVTSKAFRPILPENRFTVLSLLKDHTGKGEFAFRVYGCCETEEEAASWVKNVIGNHVQGEDVDVVHTGKWVFPHFMKEEDVDREVYRNEELDKIIDFHKRQPARIEKFKQAEGI